jgi:hypothetical protein
MTETPLRRTCDPAKILKVSAVYSQERAAPSSPHRF